ncbi:MAG: hypothetical protein ACLSHC_05835 [Bilophila wadsworthia]
MSSGWPKGIQVIPAKDALRLLEPADQPAQSGDRALHRQAGQRTTPCAAASARPATRSASTPA